MGKDKGIPSNQSRLDKFARTTSGGQPPGDTPGQSESQSSDNQILAAISELRASIEGRIGELRTDMSLIRQDLRNAVDRVTETEGRVSEIEDTQKSCQDELCQIGRAHV